MKMVVTMVGKVLYLKWSVQQIIKLPGNWHFSLILLNFFIKRKQQQLEGKSTTEQILEIRNLFKKCKTTKDGKPKVILAVTFNYLKLTDVENLLKKHYEPIMKQNASKRLPVLDLDDSIINTNYVHFRVVKDGLQTDNNFVPIAKVLNVFFLLLS